MKFGKKILSERVPGWFEYYLDYKALKKIISSVHASPDPNAAFQSYATDFEMAKEEQKASSVPKPSDGFRGSSTTSVQPLWESTEPLQPTGTPLSMTIAVNSAEYANRDPDFQMKKAAFFFKLQRELDKINAFYLKKEAELKLRIIALLSKRQAAASRMFPDSDEREMIKDHVEWQAVEEGFTLLQNDLSKLQQFVDINATGFRKILKKWDKRSKSTTKELYLARQVEVQPVFNRQLITEFSDVVAACLLNLTDTTIPLSATLREELSKHDSVLNAQLMREPLTRSRVFLDLEDSLRRAVDQNDVAAVQQALVTANELTNATDGRTYVSRILWKCAVEAEPELADLILDSPNSPCDFKFIDDINGRTSIHEAAAAGAPRLIDRCIAKGVEVNKRDSYGRTALHYAVIEGHPESVDRLLAAKADPTILDLDNFSCLYYAVVFGQLDCVRLLFRTNGPGLRLAPEGSDIDLLSLACLHGHYDIALLLLDQGANQVPNSNGQYPIHLAAGAGHAEICQLLASRARETLDIPDKYNEWTPLFHATQKGRTPAVKVLLDAGCDTAAIDELGRTPIFYAGWYGHIDCVELLLSSSRKQKQRQRAQVPEPNPKQVPVDQLDGDLEADTIPSLSLPPPIMPFRIYGHNYLDKQYLVQLTLGRPHSQFYLDQQDSPVKITAWESNLSTIPPNSRPKSLLKMIMTSRPETAAVPVNLTIPLSEERDVISFQVQDLSELALEFSFYPLFGSKTVGRAAVLPSVFENIKDSRTISLAILDHRLHIIGQATFEACIIRPFTGVTLQFGGAVDTYWKSSSHLIDKAVPPTLITPQSALDSTHTSPSNHSAIMNPSGSVTISSLSRDQLTVVIQGTRDLVPVIYSEWTLPVEGLNIGVSDVNLEQFERVAAQAGRSFEVSSLEPVMSTRRWVELISTKMMKLETLLTHLPSDVGLNIHVAFPNRAIRDLNFIGHCLDLNSYIESILLVIYRAASTQARRQVSFLSFSPSVCTALNWKQPNYPVFFASHCGLPEEERAKWRPPRPEPESDRRCTSVAAAVEFAQANNLLGVFLNASLVVKVPQLIQGAKDSNLLVGVFGSAEEVAQLQVGGAQSFSPPDAVWTDGVVHFVDNSQHGLQ